MRKLILLGILLSYFISTSFSQNHEVVTVDLQPSEGLEMKIKSKLIVKTSFTLLRENLFISERNPFPNDTVDRQVDSLIITLNSGTSWNLLYEPPEKPAFFILKVLFKNESDEVINRFNYLKFLSHFEAENDIPYYMIDKIVITENFINGSMEKWLKVNYEIKPSPMNKFEISERIVLYDRFEILKDKAFLSEKTD